MKRPTYVCCICGEEHTGYPNSAWPLKEGHCCDKCNVKVVIERIERHGIVFDRRDKYDIVKQLGAMMIEAERNH